jgi:hypothetical protein
LKRKWGHSPFPSKRGRTSKWGLSPFLLLLATPGFASDVFETPERAVAALWRALSNEPGAAADVRTLGRLFHPAAVVFGTRSQEGKPELRAIPATEFVASQAGVSERGFHECEVSRSIQRYERLAVVYSVVESRADKKAARADFTGVNSIQLYLENGSWKILSLFYHVGEESAPVPLDGGRPGACLSS